MGMCGKCIHNETAGSDYPCNICDNVTHYEEPKPTTNADRIRMMSDDQLHVLLVDFACNTKKLSQLREWLEQEV